MMDVRTNSVFFEIAKHIVLICLCISTLSNAETGEGAGNSECAFELKSLSGDRLEVKPPQSVEEIMKAYLAAADTDPVRVKEESLVNVVATTGILANGDPKSLTTAENLPGISKFLPRQKDATTLGRVNRALSLQLQVLTDLKDFQMEQAFAAAEASRVEGPQATDSRPALEAATEIGANPNLPAGFREFLDFYLEQRKASQAPLSPSFPQFIDSLKPLSE